MDLHCELPKGYRDLQRTPDFVIHKQNTDNQNLIVIEVKRFKDSSEYEIQTTVKKEIEKFNDYHKQLKYLSYIELVFGEFGKESVEINKIRKSISNKRGAFEELKEGDYKIPFVSYDTWFMIELIAINDANTKRRRQFTNPVKKAQHDKLVALVESMLELQKKHHNARMEQDKELYERRIKFVDAQIDKQVYDLYGLTEEEVKVVEESFK